MDVDGLGRTRTNVDAYWEAVAGWNNSVEGDCSRIESRGFLGRELNEQAYRGRQVLSYNGILNSLENPQRQKRFRPHIRLQPR